MCFSRVFSIHGYLRRLISLLITDDKATMESEGELKIILLSIVVANFPVCVYLYHKKGSKFIP